MSEEKKGFFARLREGLGKTSSKLTGAITSVFTQRKLDVSTLEELEEALISADIGPATSAKIAAQFGKGRFDKQIGDDEVREKLAEAIAAILQPCEQALAAKAENKPHVVLVLGVNGNGKTTTIGKLARRLKAEGKTVLLAACDTFRAAAVEQLQVWGERAGVPVVTGKSQADPASVAYAAMEQAKQRGVDILLVDTAGRLQNKANLMEELKKIVRVLGKLEENAPQEVLMVLDATTGQNAHSQLEIFQKEAGVTGLVVTKLDGTAKGGVVVALADRFGLPIHYVGVGEGQDDLLPFSARDFARGLVGLA